MGRGRGEEEGMKINGERKDRGEGKSEGTSAKLNTWQDTYLKPSGLGSQHMLQLCQT